MVENEHTILIGGQKRTSLGGPKAGKVRRHFERQRWLSEMWFFGIASQKEAQARITPRTKAEERTKKEGRPKKALMLNLDFQLPKHPVRKESPFLGIRRLVFQPIA